MSYNSPGVLALLAMSHEGAERLQKTGKDFQCVKFDRNLSRCSEVMTRHSKKALPLFCSENHTTHDDKQMFYFFFVQSLL
jgi:hypothetical protein